MGSGKWGGSVAVVGLGGGGRGAGVCFLRKRVRERGASTGGPGARGGRTGADAGDAVRAGGVEVEGLCPAGYCPDAAREMGGRGGIFPAYAH